MFASESAKRLIASVFTLLAFGVGFAVAREAAQLNWTPSGSCYTARSEHTATLLPDGHVLVAGGFHGYEVLASTELYDPVQGVFLAGPAMTSGRMNHTATLLRNGKVLVVGGQSQDEILSDAQLYDPATNSWIATGCLHQARGYHTATLLKDGKVLVTGGSQFCSPPGFAQGAPAGTSLLSAELYDPSTGKWTGVESLHIARYLHTATLLTDGRVLVTGGLGVRGLSDVLSSAEIYDPRTEAWSVTSDLPSPLLNHSATLLHDGQVLIAGGKRTLVDDQNCATAELYNPVTGNWASTGGLPTTTNAHAATLLANGNVLVTGGANETGTLDLAVLYVPASRKWTPQGRLTGRICLHTATLLQNGKILIAGGCYALGAPRFVQAASQLGDFGSAAHSPPPVPSEAAPENQPTAPVLPGVD
jgi:hypothetical protein